MSCPHEKGLRLCIRATLDIIVLFGGQLLLVGCCLSVVVVAVVGVAVTEMMVLVLLVMVVVVMDMVFMVMP